MFLCFYMKGISMKKLFLMATTLFMIAGSVQAQEYGYYDDSFGSSSVYSQGQWNIRPYVGVKAGFSSSQFDTRAGDSKDTLAMFSPAVGIQIPQWRFEFEITGLSEAEDNGDKAYLSRYMFNGYYDLPLPNSPVIPYLNAGLGWTNYEFKTPAGSGLDYSDTGNSFTWSLGAGLGINLTKNISFDIGYRYIDVNKSEFGDIMDVDISGHEGYVGARYIF